MSVGLLLSLPAPEQTFAQSVLSLFAFDQAMSSLHDFQHHLTGSLRVLSLTLFCVALMWTWVRNKFDTWSLWDIFLRMSIVSAGLIMWDTLFINIDAALRWIADGAGLIDSEACFYNLAIAPFNDLTIQGFSLSPFNFAGLDIFHLALLIPVSICGWLELLVIAAYAVTIIIQQLLVMFLYAVGPIFLACYPFDPLADLWMKWVRSYITIRTWTLVIHFFLFILSAAVSPNNITNTFSTAQQFWLPAVYLLILLIVICSSYPIARGLVGGAVAPFMTGSIVPAVVGAAGVAGVTAVGMAAGGPAGGAAGGGVGTVGKKVLAPNREA